MRTARATQPTMFDFQRLRSIAMLEASNKKKKKKKKEEELVSVNDIQ